MNDAELIDELREGMRACTDHTEVPRGFADHARRTARRRSARRAATAGLSLLAVAGVATVLATSADFGSSSHPRDAQAPNVTVNGDQAHDTAYIIKRVQAKVADDSQDNTAQQSSNYSSADISSDGSVVNLGPQTADLHDYTGPDGTLYSHDTLYNADGSPTLIGISVIGPVVNGKQPYSGTNIDTTNHTYSQAKFDYSASALGDGEGPAYLSPSLSSNPSGVRQALQSGQVTLMGTPTFNGTQTIALSIKTPGYQNILYVDPQTYQPLGQAYVPLPDNTAGQTGVSVTYWLPVTPENIAEAKNDSIPAGYTKVNNAQ